MRPSPFVLCIIASILVGLLSYISKGLLNAGFEPLQVCAYREGVTAIVFGTILLLSDRSAFRIRPKDLWMFVMFAFFNVASNVCLFTAEQHVSLQLAAMLEMTSPYFILVFGFFLFGTKINRRKVLACVIAFLGCMSVIGLADGFGDVKAMGLVFGILSGITLAAFTLGSKFVEQKRYSENTTMFYFFFFSALLTLPLADLGNTLGRVFSDIGLLAQVIAMGAFCTLVPNYIVIHVTRRMDPATVAVIITSSLIVSTVCGVLAFGDRFVWADVIGIVLIITAIMILHPPKVLRDRYGIEDEGD